jgi:purine-binding chemotaxis protein CheW
MAGKDDERARDPAPGGPAGKVTLPPFGLAKEILRQLATPERHGPLPAPRGAAPATPGSPRGKDSLLQFADAVMTVGGEAPAAAPEQEEHLVTFLLGNEEYGVPVLRAREIVRVGEMTRIPEAPPHIRGVFNLRGRILPVVDLRTRLGLPAAEPSARSRLVLVDAHGRVLALLVDSVSRMAHVPRSALKPPPPEALSAHTDYLTGVADVGGRLIIVLDLDRVLLLPAAAGEASAARLPAAAAPLPQSAPAGRR